MASSIACTSGSVGLSKSKLSSTAPLDPLGGLRSMRDCVSTRRRGLGTIKAMRAKYKGTQMKGQRLTEMIEEKVVQAREVCEGDATSVECRVAWDEVEEVSTAKADLRERIEKEDPLEYFCVENPETDECSIYED
ncbi:unnamed protein product [Rhodiola kirilowii]